MASAETYCFVGFAEGFDEANRNLTLGGIGSCPKFLEMKIYLVLHHEIMGAPENYRADEMVFYTAKSLKKALDLIRKSGVSRWSWWEIQVHEMDTAEWPEHVGYFGLRGGKLAKPPYEKCLAIYQKEQDAC